MRYRIEEVTRSTDAVEWRLVFPETSGLFAGHFPGNPILPGVAQVQVCCEVMAEALEKPLFVHKIDAIRYRKPVLPNAPCSLRVSLPDAEGEVTFKWQGEEGAISEGRLQFGGLDA